MGDTSFKSGLMKVWPGFFFYTVPSLASCHALPWSRLLGLMDWFKICCGEQTQIWIVWQCGKRRDFDMDGRWKPIRLLLLMWHGWQVTWDWFITQMMESLCELSKYSSRVQADTYPELPARPTPSDGVQYHYDKLRSMEGCRHGRAEMQSRSPTSEHRPWANLSGSSRCCSNFIRPAVKSPTLFWFRTSWVWELKLSINHFLPPCSLLFLPVESLPWRKWPPAKLLWTCSYFLKTSHDSITFMIQRQLRKPFSSLWVKGDLIILLLSKALFFVWP